MCHILMLKILSTEQWIIIKKNKNNESTKGAERKQRSRRSTKNNNKNTGKDVKIIRLLKDVDGRIYDYMYVCYLLN